MSTALTRPRNVFTRTAAMIVATVTAGAVFATTTGAHAAEPAPKPAAAAPTTPVAPSADDDGLAGFTAEERQQAAAFAKGISQLGVTEEQFAAALDVALSRPALDTADLRKRLAALPEHPTAEQTVQAAYPGDAQAQAALTPLLADDAVRRTALALLAESSGEKRPAVMFGWWDETKFVVKCSAAVAGVLLSFVPAGSSIKVVRAVALFKRYGAKKTANIIWRFVNGKRIGSNEREAVKAFIGISAISAACSR
ncbi:hypothetical protein [Streptomyces sp. XD-27]|uniref:hypothetical protein n=1 Tax=Streptomyces sp. XD-27 TaxID=3062779 RepID=UPI0026F4245A|nr:hypothetical protein [Streptomyces sp. XD-27]WKX72111.1 hypothetical protein Q3Y56_21370 [Streptomyces sp. XD-27]